MQSKQALICQVGAYCIGSIANKRAELVDFTGLYVTNRSDKFSNTMSAVPAF